MLEILEMMFQAPDVTATQQMGVQMSNAVREKGVVIIQNQNVEVMARIGPPVLKVLRMLEEIADKRLEPVTLEIQSQPQLQLAEPERMTPVDAINDACAQMFENGVNWDSMQDLMRTRYIEYVVDHFGTKREAAEFLKVGPTYLSKMITHPKQPKTLMEVLHD
jgi:hypothetical protein